MLPYLVRGIPLADDGISAVERESGEKMFSFSVGVRVEMGGGIS